MAWLLPRLLAVCALSLLGAAIGLVVGSNVGAPLLGVGAGTLAGAALWTVIDTLRGARLMRWLRAGSAGTAPRGRGLWGEMAYRIERSQRSAAQALDGERGRLGQLLSAMEASPNGVLLLDAAERITWCNAVAADHFGLDPVRDLQQRITNLVRAPAFVAHLQEGVATDDDEPVRFPGRRGTLSVLARRFGDGMTLVLSQDVTQRERAEAMRRDFVANVSHEMRTPLTVLAGFVETLSTLSLTEAERARMLTLMAQQTTRMQSLLADLLTLAQLEGSGSPSTDRWLRLTPLLGRLEADVRALSAGRHVIRFVAAPATELAGSEGELASAFGNLLSNAVRYTPDGGTIDVCWRLRGDGGGEFEVVDSGIGIAREHLPRLTERFYRVDGSRSRDTGGTGLGLAIVKHVAQRHGGELQVQSDPGRGSTFRLVLPAARVRSTSDVGEAAPRVETSR